MFLKPELNESWILGVTYLLFRETVYDFGDLVLAPRYGGGQPCPSLSHPERQADEKERKIISVKEWKRYCSFVLFPVRRQEANDSQERVLTRVQTSSCALQSFIQSDFTVASRTKTEPRLYFPLFEVLGLGEQLLLTFSMRLLRNLGGGDLSSLNNGLTGNWEYLQDMGQSLNGRKQSLWRKSTAQSQEEQLNRCQRSSANKLKCHCSVKGQVEQNKPQGLEAQQRRSALWKDSIGRESEIVLDFFLLQKI